MPFTSSKMGLAIWNLVTDLYDHAQLADNWAKIDYHDHSPGRGVQIPGEGIADEAIGPNHLRSDFVFETTPDTMTPDSFGVRTLSEGRARLEAADNGHRAFAANGTVDADGATNTTTFLRGHLQFFAIEGASLALGSHTPKLRLRAAALANGVDPGATLTFGLYALNADGSGNNSLIARIPAIGAPAPVTGSTIAMNPTATTDTWDTSAGFTVPADGIYVFGVQIATAVAANSAVHLYSALDVYYV